MNTARAFTTILIMAFVPSLVMAQCDLSKCGCMKREFKSKMAYLAWSPSLIVDPDCGTVDGGTTVSVTISLVPKESLAYVPPPRPRGVQAVIFAIDYVFVGGKRISDVDIVSTLPSSRVGITFEMPTAAAAGIVDVEVFYHGGYTCKSWLGVEKKISLPSAAVGEFEYIDVRYPVITDACPGYLDAIGGCTCLNPPSTPADRNVDPPCCADGLHTLTIIGSGFHRDDDGNIPMVWIDGEERAQPNVVFVSESELRVAMPDKTFSVSGFVEVTVRNPPFDCGHLDCSAEACGVFYIPQGGCTTESPGGPKYENGFVGRGPHYVDTGNVIDDPAGFKDVVVASVTEDGGMLTILEGHGDGSVTGINEMDDVLRSERQLRLGSGPTAIDAGDLNDDGFSDVVVAMNDDAVLCFQNRGARWSSGAVLEIVGATISASNPTDVKIADVAGAGGVPDILVASSTSAGIRLVLGWMPAASEWSSDLQVTLALKDETGAACNAIRLATGEVDGDGVTDFAAITDHSTIVLYGGVSSPMESTVPMPVRIDGMTIGSLPVDVKMIPLSSDGRLGLAVLRQDRSIDLISYDHATSTLVEPPVNIPLTEKIGTPIVMTKGDFNDGNEGDLVVAYSDGSVEVVFLDFTAGPRLLGTQVIKLPDLAPISDLAADKLNVDPTTREDLVIAPGSVSNVVIAVNRGAGFE